MAQHNKTCTHCKLKGHSKFYCPTRPNKQPERKHFLPKPVKNKPTSAKKSPTSKKKATKTALKKKLEKLVKDYVKRRDNYTCQKCDEIVSGSNCHASHVIPVSRSGYLQFEPLNMKVLCYHDHINWWHKHPVEAGKWFTDTFPERWEYLQSLHIQRLKPMNEAQLQEKIEEYTKLLQD